MDSSFQYRAHLERGESLLENDGGPLFEELRARLADIGSLIFLQNCYVFPFDHAEDQSEERERLSFSADRWEILAAVINDEDEVKNFLISSRVGDVSYVLTGDGLEILFAVYGSYEIVHDDQTVTTIGAAPEIKVEKPSFVPQRKGVPRNLTASAVPECEAEKFYNFTAGVKESGQTVFINGGDRHENARFFAENGKRAFASLHRVHFLSKVFIVGKALPQDDPFFALPSTFSRGDWRFAACVASSGDWDAIARILLISREDPMTALVLGRIVDGDAPIYAFTRVGEIRFPLLGIEYFAILNATAEEPAPEGSQEAVEGEGVTPSPAQITPPSFVPASNKRPKRIPEETPPSEIAIDSYVFGQNHAEKGLTLWLYHRKKPDAVEYLRSLDEYLQNKEAKVRVSFPTRPFFASPKRIPFDHPACAAVRGRFPFSDFRALAATSDREGAVHDILLSNIKNPDFCYVIGAVPGSKDAFYVYLISENGVDFPPDATLTFASLIHEASPIEEEAPAREESAVTTEETGATKGEKEEPAPTVPAREEPAPKEEPTPIKPLFATPEKKKATLKPRRRLFESNRFRRDEEGFLRKYHESAEEDFTALKIKLLSASEEELNEYLASRDAKNIGSGEHQVRKFQFGSSREYIASRVFFMRGYDTNRKIDSKDIILLAVSGQGEHEKQDDIARVCQSQLSTPDLVLHEAFLPSLESGEPETLPYPSSEQWKLLDAASSKLPAAFIGGAGTGKTLLSLRQYAQLSSSLKKGRILYLTYARELCDYAKRMLAGFSLENVEALTFRDLARGAYGEGTAGKMEGKEDFRDWYFHFMPRNKRLAKRIKTIFPRSEERFLACYILYRGIIDGSSEAREGILGEEEFLAKVKDEEGLTLDQKKAVYEVALAYESHLKETGRYTDNGIARRMAKDGFSYYDAVVIDEYQDLSEMQFLAIAGLCKSKEPLALFLYGDDDQAINPTIFDLEDAKRILYDDFSATLTVERLSDSYRSGPTLLSYINGINRVRRKAIGARGAEVRVDRSKRQDEADLYASLLSDEKVFGSLLKTASSSDADCVFLFPSRETLEEWEKKAVSLGVGSDFIDSSFLTVEQAKGRQWDIVVLVDFFSSASATFEAMLGERREGHKSTLHRMFFNRYYVALTRAENRIIVYESKAESSPLIKENLLNGLSPIQSEAELSSYFRGGGDPERWLRVGDNAFRSRAYDDAVRAYSRVKGTNEGAERYAVAMAYLKASRGELPREEEVSLYLDYGDDESLKEYYRRKGPAAGVALIGLLGSEGNARAAAKAYREASPRFGEREKEAFFLRLLSCYRGEFAAFRAKLAPKEDAHGNEGR
jgi:hypothetical protein